MAKRIVLLIFTISASLFLASCASGISTRYSAVPLALNGIKTTLASGQLVASQNRKNVVSLYIEEGQINADLTTSIYLAITNNSSRPLTIDPQDIIIRASHEGNESLVGTYSKQAAINLTKQKYEIQASFKILMGALSAASASYNASHKYQYGSVNGYIGSTPIYGTYSTTVYDPAAGIAAAEERERHTINQIDDLYDQMNADLFNLNKVLLDAKTIAPKQTYAGMILIKPLQGVDNLEVLSITVPFGGEQYVFKYRVMKNRGLQ